MKRNIVGLVLCSKKQSAVLINGQVVGIQDTDSARQFAELTASALGVGVTYGVYEPETELWTWDDLVSEVRYHKNPDAEGSKQNIPGVMGNAHEVLVAAMRVTTESGKLNKAATFGDLNAHRKRPYKFEVTVSAVVRATGLKKPVVMAALHQLSQKGLVRLSIDGALRVKLTEKFCFEAVSRQWVKPLELQPGGTLSDNQIHVIELLSVQHDQATLESLQKELNFYKPKDSRKHLPYDYSYLRENGLIGIKRDDRNRQTIHFTRKALKRFGICIDMPKIDKAVARTTLTGLTHANEAFLDAIIETAVINGYLPLRSDIDGMVDEDGSHFKAIYNKLRVLSKEGWIEAEFDTGRISLERKALQYAITTLKHEKGTVNTMSTAEHPDLVKRKRKILASINNRMPVSG